MDVLLTTSDVIDELGGNRAVGELTETRPSTVSMWRSLGKFPWRTEVPIKEALQARHMTAPRSLWGITQKRSDA